MEKVKVIPPPTIEQVERFMKKAVALLEEGEAMMSIGINGKKRLPYETGRPLALFNTHLEEGIFWIGRMLDGMEKKAEEKIDVDNEDTGIDS